MILCSANLSFLQCIKSKLISQPSFPLEKCQVWFEIQLSPNTAYYTDFLSYANTWTWNSSEKSWLTCRPASKTTCWYLLFGLLCFHVERPGFEGQIHLRRWPRKLKKRCKLPELLARKESWYKSPNMESDLVSERGYSALVYCSE